MRRIPAILLLLLFSIPLIGPLFASTPQNNLPACCRRNGQHHCTAMLESSGKLPAAAAPCPNFPTASIPFQLHPVAYGGSPTPKSGVVASDLSLRPPNGAYQFDPNLSRHNRGPPALLA